MNIKQYKSKSNIKLLRAADGFVPAALLAASFFGRGRSALTLALAFLLVEALSLFSAHGVRIAFAAQPSMRDVRGSVKCALLLQVAAAAVSSAILLLFFRERSAALLPFLGAGWLLNIEHTFYEYLVAAGDKRSATLCQALAAMFMLTGLLMAADAAQNAWIPAMAGISAAVAFVVGAVMGDGLKGRLNAQVVRSAPRAALQGFAYPLAAALASRFLLPSFSCGAILAGLTLFELCRTPFRRSRTEAPPLNRSLLIVSGIAAIALSAIRFLPFLPDFLLAQKEEIAAFSALLLTAAVVVFCLYGNTSKCYHKE